MGENLIVLRASTAPMASRTLAAQMPSSRCVMAVVQDGLDRSAPCGSAVIWANIELHGQHNFAVSVSRNGGRTWVSLVPTDANLVPGVTQWWQYNLLGRSVAIFLFSQHEDVQPNQVR